VTGQIPALDSLDQALKRSFGFGIPFGTTTAREASAGRARLNQGSWLSMVRMTGSMENQMYKRMFTKALESERICQADHSHQNACGR